MPLRDVHNVWERSIIALARDRHGIVTRAEAVTRGATTQMIRSRVTRGLWTELHPGVYYLDVTPTTWKSDVLSGVMATGVDAVASHRTAAILHGMEGIKGHMIDVTAPFADRPEPDGVVVHRTRRPIDSITVDGIPITTPARTILDLAAMLGDRLLERVMASAFRIGVCSPEQVDAIIGRRGGRGVGGTRRARRVLRLVTDDLSGSTAEVEFGQLIRDAQIPEPVAQLKIRLPGGNRHAYPDFAWPDRMRIAEVDGLEAHANADQLAHDLDRQNQLLDLGWEIRRWPARTIRRQPQKVMDELTIFVNKPSRPRSVEPARV